MKQYLLIAISSILLTMSAYHFFLYLVVKIKRKRYLYFAISTFGGCIFVFFAFLMFNQSPENILLFHRLRMLGLMICISAWAYCMYTIYFKNSRIPLYYLLFTLLCALTVPTNYFLSLPVQEFNISIGSSVFQYFYASTRIAYSVYAISILVFFVYSFIRVAVCSKPPVSKFYGLMAFFPGVVGGINDFAVTHEFIRNIMLSEFLVFTFLLSVFMLFIREEKQDYIVLKRLNLKLEDEVLHRTQGLSELNNKLVIENNQRKKAEYEKEQVIEELSQALEKVQTLSGLLPICARCKKIRDDEGYWQQIESYIRDHSKADFTHSLCPECIKELYGNIELSSDKDAD